MNLRSRNSPLQRFLSYAAPVRWYIIGAALAGVVKFVIPLGLPLVLKYVADVVLARHPEAASEPTNLWIGRWCEYWLAAIPSLGAGPGGHLAVLGLSGGLLCLVLVAASFYRMYWAGRARHLMMFDLRCALFQHVQSLSHSFFEQRRSGAIVARFTSDLQQAQAFIGAALTNVWMDGAALIAVAAILFVLEPRLAALALAIMPLYAALIRYFSPRIKAASHEVQELIEDFTGDLQERIAAAGVVKAFGREDEEARRFHLHTQRLRDVTLRNTALSSAQQALTAGLTTAAPLIVVCLAGVLVVRGQLSVGSMIAVYAYLGSLYLPLQRFSELSVTISNSLAAMERIFEFFDTRPEVEEAAAAATLIEPRGQVSFERVTFRYPGGDGRPPALCDVSLTVEPGEVVAIVGRSGAGKSTLSALIPRFYDPTDGRVCVDGIDVRQLTLDSLRARIAIVPQDPILFSGTVRENLLYGRPDASDAELRAAAHAAHADAFLRQFPDGMLTVVGERGMTLSAGQRQRLAIARAFLRDPRILILDEATANLDSESENLIHDALWRLMRGRTTFVIAHRLAAAVHADRVLVLDHGRLAELGSHTELIAADGVYARLWREQGRQRPRARTIAEPPRLLHP